MHTADARPVPSLVSLPASDDPGARFLGPRHRPETVAATAAEVLAATGLGPRLDRDAVLSFLAFDRYDSRRSFFSGLELVPPRCLVRRTADGRLAVTDGRAPPFAALDRTKSLHAFRAALEASARRAIGTAERVGIWLSGGLDSSVVAAAASRVWARLGRAPRDLVAFHFMPPPGAPSELEHAAAVAHALGHPLHEVPYYDGDLFDGAEPWYAGLDIPSDSGGAAPYLALLRRLRDEGIEVSLTGDGGAEAVRDYAGRPLRGGRSMGERMRALWQGLWTVLPEHARARWRHRPGSALPADTPTFLARRARHLPSPLAAPPARRGLGGLAARRDRAVRCASVCACLASMRAGARAMGTRVATPYLDAAVLDLLVTLPQQHFAGSLPKAFLREAFADALPERTRVRPKDQPPCEPPLVATLARRGAAWIDAHLRGGALEQMDIVPRAAQEELLREALSGAPIPLYRFLGAVHLERWSAVRGIQPA